MSKPKKLGNNRPVENRHLTWILVIVLFGFGIGTGISCFVIPSVAWFLAICFAYILALECILVFQDYN